MTWNYRIIDFVTHLALHEVFYDENRKPRSYTEDAISFIVDPEEGIEGIRGSLVMALRACDQPTLSPSDFLNSNKDNIE